MALVIDPAESTVDKASPKERSIILYPVEATVCAFGVMALILYWHYEIALRSPIELYWGRISGGVVMYAWGLLVALLVVRGSKIRRFWLDGTRTNWRDTWLDFKTLYLDKRYLLRDFRLYNAIALMFVVFINLKNLVPLVTGRVYGTPKLVDQTLVRWEEAWFGGKIASLHVIELFGTQAATILSFGYTLFYPYVAILIFTFVLQRDTKLQQEFLLAFVLTWFFGILIVYLLPTWGPIFLHPELFTILPATECSEMQAKLWHMKLFLEQNPKDPGGVYLISGLPSLHVAIVALGSIYLRRLSLWLSRGSWALLVVTVITTLYFGWHYVLDDIAAFFLIALSIFSARKLLNVRRSP